MTGIDGGADDYDGASRDQKVRLWATLIVATLMVGLTAYVLSFALLGPGWNPPPHRSAATTIHART